MKDKLLISFLITFSCVADLLVLAIIPGYHSINLGITFIQLGEIFMLQHKFKVVRVMLLVCLSFLDLYKGWKFVLILDLSTVSNLSTRQFSYPVRIHFIAV